jgi:hypothetical protein
VTSVRYSYSVLKSTESRDISRIIITIINNCNNSDPHIYPCFLILFSVIMTYAASPLSV